MKLSKAQLALVQHMRQHPSPLIRLPGGFWLTEETKPQGHIQICSLFNPKFWPTQTVRTLLKKGVIYSITPTLPPWNSRYKLSETFTP